MHYLPVFSSRCTGVKGGLSLWLGATGPETLAPLGHGSPAGDRYQAPGFLFVLTYFHRPLLRASTQALEQLEATENVSTYVEAGLFSALIST